MAGSPAQLGSTLGVSIGTRLCWETPGWRTTLELISAFLKPGLVDAHGSLCPQPQRVPGQPWVPSDPSVLTKALERGGSLRILSAPTLSASLEQVLECSISGKELQSLRTKMRAS